MPALYGRGLDIRSPTLKKSEESYSPFVMAKKANRGGAADGRRGRRGESAGCMSNGRGDFLDPFCGGFKVGLETHSEQRHAELGV